MTTAAVLDPRIDEMQFAIDRADTNPVTVFGFGRVAIEDDDVTALRFDRGAHRARRLNAGRRLRQIYDAFAFEARTVDRELPGGRLFPVRANDGNRIDPRVTAGALLRHEVDDEMCRALITHANEPVLLLVGDEESTVAVATNWNELDLSRTPYQCLLLRADRIAGLIGLSFERSANWKFAVLYAWNDLTAAG